MALTLADVDRWDAGAVRDVSAALAKRGASATDVKTGLTKLPLIATWQGSGGDAARASLDKLSAYLAAHGEEMNKVSSATSESADDIEGVKNSLRRIEEDAKHEGFSIDMDTGEVTPLNTQMTGDPIYAMQQADLMTRITQLLEAANTADADLAKALTSAGADAAGRPQDPRVLDALNKPLPDDPKQFHDLWEQLTPEQKDALFQRDHSIANRPSMPAVDRDYYNRLALPEALKNAQDAQATADALKAAHPDWANGQNLPPKNTPGAIFDDRLKYEAWQQQYDAARAGAKYLPDLQAVDKSVTGFPDRKLLLLDTKSGDMVHAAVAIGNPDTATHVSVTAPGLNTTVHDAMTGMSSEATNLRAEAIRQLEATPGHEAESVSTIAWIGYDAPQIPGFDEKGASLDGAWGVSHDDVAKVGAHDLARFYDGLTISHEGVPAELTAIGHSYGSLTTGLALQEPGNHGVTDAIFYGSPGIEATTPAQLQLPNGHVFTMETPNDPIQAVYDGPPALKAGAAMLPPPFNSLALGGLEAMDLTGTGQFGPNPATNPNFTHLATGPSVVSDGNGGTMTLGGASGHSDYPRFMDDGTPRTTNYNIAAIIAGLGDDAIRQK